MFNKSKGKMYYVNAYFDVIDDFITIYIFPQNGSFFYDIHNELRHNVQ